MSGCSSPLRRLQRWTGAGSTLKFGTVSQTLSSLTIGAGSTVGKDVPAGKLTVARAKQLTLEGWKRPVKKKP